MHFQSEFNASSRLFVHLFTLCNQKEVKRNDDCDPDKV